MDFLGRSEQELTNPFNPFDEIVLENSVRRNKHESELKLQKKMKKNCEKWEAKCSELKLKLKDMKHMKNAACNKQDTLRAENKNLIEAYEIIREANEKIIAENEQFRQHNKSMQVKVEKKLRICTDYKGMQNRYASISIENDRLHERIENLKREKCYDGNVELLNDNRHLKNVNKHMKKELLICAEKIAEVTKLVRSHRKNSKKWHQFQEKSECAKKKFFDVYDDVCMENENLLQINDALRSHNECIENALKTMREKFEKFADYDDIHDQHTIVANENVRLRHEIENMKKEMREVREERNEQSAKRKHIRNENGKILSEYDRIETDHAELLEENAILRQVNQDILKELEHAREKHQCVTKKCNDLKALNQKDNGSSDAVSAGGVNPCKDDRYFSFSFSGKNDQF